MESRIRFKQRVLVYKSLNGTAPVYIAETCIRRSFETEHYQLRSVVRGEFVVCVTKNVTLGIRSHRYAAPSLWNAHPQDIRELSLFLSQFHSKLKTFLHREVTIVDSRSAFVMFSS